MDGMFMFLCLLSIAAAAGLDIAANLFLSKSRGFKNLRYGFAALFLVSLAFLFLSFGLRGIDLAVAYALWGAFGILGTSIGGWLLLGQRLRAPAWGGIALLICGMGVLRFA